MDESVKCMTCNMKGQSSDASLPVAEEAGNFTVTPKLRCIIKAPTCSVIPDS